MGIGQAFRVRLLFLVDLLRVVVLNCYFGWLLVVARNPGRVQ